MFININADCCRTPGCKNLGLLNSQGYVTQGKSISCRECDYLFLAMSERSFSTYRNIVNHSWRGLICQCSACKGTPLKRYGYSAQDQRGMHRHHCGKTFITLEHVVTTPRGALLVLMIEQGEVLAGTRKSLLFNNTGPSRELLKLACEVNYKEGRQCFLASDITLSTRAFCTRYSGNNNSPYVLATVEEQSGRVAAISTNYFPSAVGQHYQYTSSYEERMPPGTLAYHVRRKELLTMRRDTLFGIDYGPAVLHQNDPGMLVKLVLLAYHHFRLVRILTDEYSDNVRHYLDHEYFMLGGCLMVNLQHTHQGHCRIPSVKECDVTSVTIDFPPRLSLSGGV